MKELILRRNKKAEEYLEFLSEGYDEKTALEWASSGNNGRLRIAQITSSFSAFLGVLLSLYPISPELSLVSAFGVLAASALFWKHIQTKTALTKEKLPLFLTSEQLEWSEEKSSQNELATELQKLFKKDIKVLMKTYFDFYNNELSLRIRAEMAKRNNKKEFLLEIINPESEVHKKIKKKSLEGGN